MTVPLVTMAKIIIWCAFDQILESFKVLGMQFKSITHITKSVHLQSAVMQVCLYEIYIKNCTLQMIIIFLLICLNHCYSVLSLWHLMKIQYVISCQIIC
jgi:hypothetical protein